MIVAPERCQHNVADDIGVVRHFNTDGIFDGVNRSQGVYASTDAADTFNERPRIARVAPLQDDLQPAKHRAAGDGIGDHILIVNIHFTTHVAFNARNRVDHQAASGIIDGVSLSFVLSAHACLSSLPG